MADLLVRPPAEADVRDAVLWYQSRREGLGAEFALQLDALYERIAENPRQFPEIDVGARRALLRRFPYAVYFMIDREVPVVVAVLHQHRRPEAWRGRL